LEDKNRTKNWQKFGFAFSFFVCLLVCLFVCLQRLPKLLAGVDSLVTEFLLDPEELIVLGKALRAAGGAGLDLAGPEAHHKVGNEGVLCLAAAVADHDPPASRLGKLAGANSLGEGANLVDLEEEGVDGLLVNGGLDPLGVGDEQVIPDGLNRGGGLELDKGIPVILSKPVLEGHDGVVTEVPPVEVGELLSGEPLGRVRVRVLEVQVVLAIVVELGCGSVHANGNLASVAGLGDGGLEELESLTGVLDVGGKAALVANVGGVLAVLLLDDGLEGVIDLSGHAHGLLEGGRTNREDHELLHGELVAGMGSAVDDVERWNRKEHLVMAREICQVPVQGDALLGSPSLGHGKGDPKDGVGAELGLVLGAIQLDEEGIDLLLVGHVKVLLDQGWGDDVVDIGNGLQDA